MPEHRILSVDQALEAEYRHLRPLSSDPSGGDEQPLTALCISGGGIRSATFALGALQGLAEAGLLGTFDYLSTVSGGGYIGAWLTAWKQRAHGIEKVLPYLRRNAAPIPDNQPDPIRHLREYNNYLSPKMGLFSADTWTLVATVTRNMILNWMVFLPLLMAALMVPRLALSFARMGETFYQFYGGIPDGAVDLVSDLIPAVACLLFAIAIYNVMRYLPAVGGEENSEFDVLKWVVMPLLLAAMAFVTEDSWFSGGDTTVAGNTSPYLVPMDQVMVGVVAAALAGCIAYVLFCKKRAGEKLRIFARVLAPVTIGAACAGAVAWMLCAFIYPTSSWPLYTTVAVPLLLLSVLLAGCIFVGFSSRILDDEDREWLSRAGAWVLITVVGWTGICALVLLAPGSAIDYAGQVKVSGALGAPAWLKSILATVGAVSGWVSAVGGKSAETSATKGDPGLTRLALRAAMTLGPPVFAIAVGIGLAIGTDWLLQITRLGPDDPWWKNQAILEGTRWESVLGLALLLLGLSSLMAQVININKFSLQATYRNRLIRAYLGASNDRRNANKFTGFAESDNFKMGQLDPHLKPFHVINTTLNLVAGRRLAWQQRKAESFTISPLHCGSCDLGYRPSAQYGKEISLGTAITISGAAANPNMGYHSSPMIGFIMTLFNARLGSWLGNPGRAGDKTWNKDGPTSATGSLVMEAFGLTNNSNPWVNLSDGGHFENLGLYEMVRRRCRYIVLLDGTGDGDLTCADLGNALRKIRIDFKIAIEFEGGSFEALREKKSRTAIAHIDYGDAAGYLIYVKPMIRGNEEPDVLSYFADHPDFPHQSTADQFFDESQTESYRALGAHTIAEMCAGWDGEEGLAGLAAHFMGAKQARRAATTGAAGAV